MPGPTPPSLGMIDDLMRGRLAIVACLVSACFSESDGGDGSASTAASASSAGSSGSGGATSGTAESASSASDEVGTVATTAASDSTGGTSCPPRDTVPEIPAGWTGPYVLVPRGPLGETPPCPPALDDDGVGKTNPLPMPCDCNCAPSCVATMSTMGCMDDGGEVPLAPGCVGIEPMSFVGGVGPSGAMAACAAPVPSDSKVQWEDELRSCAGPTGASCLPAPLEAIGPCIRRDGDQVCPDPSLERHVTHTGAQLTCDACPSCIQQAIAACGQVTLTGYDGPNCLGDATLPFDGGACSPMSVASIDVDVPVPMCAPATSTITGPTGTVTFCCAG